MLLQVSDFLAFAKIAYRILDAYKNVPYECQNIVEKAGEVARTLDRLESILRDTGKLTYLTNDENWKISISKALHDAEAYLERYVSLRPEAGMLYKIRKVTRFSMDKREIERYSRSLDDQISKLMEIKIDIILHAALGNLRRQALSLPEPQKQMYGIETISDLSSSHPDVLNDYRSSPTDILVKAATSIHLAHSSIEENKSNADTSDVSRVISSPSHIMHYDQPVEVQTFRQNVVDEIETSRLYSSDTVISDHRKSVERIADWLDTVKGASSQVSAINAELGSISLPSLRRTPTSLQEVQLHDAPSDHQDLMSLSYQPTEQQRVLQSSHGYSMSRRGLSKVGHDHEDSVRGMAAMRINTSNIQPEPDISTTRKQINLASTVYIANAYTGRHWFMCRLEVSTSEGSICIWATTFTESVQMSSTDSVKYGKTYRHAINDRVSSYPYVHHPDTETAGDFLIQFHNPQFTDEVDKTLPAGFTSKLRYRFESKQDRDKIRQIIYGKRLLLTAGYEKATSIRVCDIQALSLWEDFDKDREVDGEDSSRMSVPHQDHTQREIYMTFPANRNGSNACPDRTVEYIVRGCRYPQRAERSGAWLDVQLEPTTTPPIPSNIKTDDMRDVSDHVISGGMDPNGRRRRRQNTNNSQHTMNNIVRPSRLSRLSSFSHHQSPPLSSLSTTNPNPNPFPNPGPDLFNPRPNPRPKIINSSIKLSDDNPDLSRDKRSVLDLLKARFSSSSSVVSR